MTIYKTQTHQDEVLLTQPLPLRCAILLLLISLVTNLIMGDIGVTAYHMFALLMLVLPRTIVTKLSSLMLVAAVITHAVGCIDAEVNGDVWPLALRASLDILTIPLLLHHQTHRWYQQKQRQANKRNSKEIRRASFSLLFSALIFIAKIVFTLLR